jgi:hypothetical protein
MSKQVYLSGGFSDAKEGTNAEGNEHCNYHTEVLSRGSHKNRLSGAKHQRKLLAIEIRSRPGRGERGAERRLTELGSMSK